MRAAMSATLSTNERWCIGRSARLVATTKNRLPVDQLAALADPTRLDIIAQLRTQDLCVCHLIDRLGLKQSIVSHHVGILRRAGLVTSSPNASDRRWLYYRLNREALGALTCDLEWLVDDADDQPTPAPCGPDVASAAAADHGE